MRRFTVLLDVVVGSGAAETCGPRAVLLLHLCMGVALVSWSSSAWSQQIAATYQIFSPPESNLVRGPQVIAQLVGEELLPWEDEVTARALLRGAARFRGAMQALLNRDATQRPSADAFMQQCHALLASTIVEQD